MKALLLSTTASIFTLAAFGQGIVNFSNASSTPGWADPAFDRYAHWGPGAATFNSALTAGGLVSSNYAGVDLRSLRATLCYAPTSNNDPFLAGYVQASGGAATFKVSTSTTAGSWFGGNRTLDTIAPGTMANLVVVVWDINYSADPLSPAARMGLYGHSAVFQYTPPTDPQAQPSDFLMTGLTAFTVEGDIPEPSTFGLAAIGAAALLILHRRRGSLEGELD
jgi:hypothetical protein